MNKEVVYVKAPTLEMLNNGKIVPLEEHNYYLVNRSLSKLNQEYLKYSIDYEKDNNTPVLQEEFVDKEFGLFNNIQIQLECPIISIPIETGEGIWCRALTNLDCYVIGPTSFSWSKERQQTIERSFRCMNLNLARKSKNEESKEIKKSILLLTNQLNAIEQKLNYLLNESN